MATPDTARGGDLYFAILPDQDARMKITALVERLRREHGLGTPPVASECLHVSLQWAGEVTWQPERLLAAARQAGAAIAARPFLVSFDRVLSFKGRDRSPLVLATSEDLIALAALRKMLGIEIEKSGLGRRARSAFEPHITLLYDDRSVHEMAVEPIAWMVRSFVLIQNRHGEGRHVHHASWDLRG